MKKIYKRKPCCFLFVYVYTIDVYKRQVETLTGEELKNVEFQEVRGTEGIKEATYNVAGMDVKVAVASGLGNARKLRCV